MTLQTVGKIPTTIIAHIMFKLMVYVHLMASSMYTIMFSVVFLDLITIFLNLA